MNIITQSNDYVQYMILLGHVQYLCHYFHLIVILMKFLQVGVGER